MFGGLPMWVYDTIREHDLAKMQCAFDSEWLSGTSKYLPEHVTKISTATFESWNKGGWNYKED